MLSTIDDMINKSSSSSSSHLLKYKTSNIASKIKKLESKFSRNTEPEIVSTNELSTVLNYQNTNRFTHQSPKFLQLFQKHTDLANSSSDTRNINAKNSRAEKVTEVSKYETDSSNDNININLRKMTSSSSIGSSSSSSSSSSSGNE